MSRTPVSRDSLLRLERREGGLSHLTSNAINLTIEEAECFEVNLHPECCMGSAKTVLPLSWSWFQPRLSLSSPPWLR